MRKQSERGGQLWSWMISPARLLVGGEWEKREPLVIRWIDCFPADGSRPTLRCISLITSHTHTHTASRHQQHTQSGVIFIFLYRYFLSHLSWDASPFPFRNSHIIRYVGLSLNVSLNDGISSSYWSTDRLNHRGPRHSIWFSSESSKFDSQEGQRIVVHTIGAPSTSSASAYPCVRHLNVYRHISISSFPESCGRVSLDVKWLHRHRQDFID